MRKNKKKILFNVSGSGVLSSNKGGAIERIVANQSKYFSDEFEVIIFGPLFPLNKNVKNINYDRRMSLNLGIKSFLNDIIFLILGLWKMRKINADIIVSTHERNFILSLFYAKIKKKPLIAWELDHVFWISPWTIIKKVYHYLVKKATLVVTESSQQKRRMIKQYIDSDKIRVIYAPIDIDKYYPLDKESNSNYILYVAKFTERKNQLLLLKAFNNIAKKYDDFKLVLVGPKRGAFTGAEDSVSEYYIRCMGYIKASHLENKVIFYENLEEEKLVKLYQEATLFVFPSLEEGFGMTLLEAMACGCPCISNNIEPMREVLGEAGILIDTSDVNLLSGKIMFLLNDPELRRKLGKLARERAVSLFSSDKIHRQFEEIIIETLKKRKRIAKKVKK